MSEFAERVYDAVRKIPAGRVATYGQVAVLAGYPGAAQAVGTALHFNPYEPGEVPDELAVPCHRVVSAAGKLAQSFAFDGPMEQKARLEAEGVEVGDDFTVDLEKFGMCGKS